MDFRLRTPIAIVAAAAAILAAPSQAGAQAEFSVVHSFTKPSAPSGPGGLIEGTDGNFYGTSGGGTARQGTIFRITPAGAVSVLHEFTQAEGTTTGGLLQASDGNFYGVTSYSIDARFYRGTAYKMTPDGDLSLVHTFNFLEGTPSGAMVQGADGDFYGSTSYGLIFKMSAAGTYAGLASLQGSISRLTQATDGNFYGTSRTGGAFGVGYAFRMTPGGSVTVLHDFRDYIDGYPGELLRAADGNFYGTTLTGGSANTGTIFRMTTAGAVSVLYSFILDAVGPSPSGRLIEGPDGSLYGSTLTSSYANTVFKMAPDGSVSLIHTFVKTTEGFWPVLGFLRAADGNLYGTAAGAEASSGTVFKLTLAGDITVLSAFPGDEQGAEPVAIVRAADGKFYGTTSSGGTFNRGTVFAITPDGLVTWLHSFTEDEGFAANSDRRLWSGQKLVQASDGNLYGTTTFGYGAPRSGIAFRMTTAGAFTALHEFSGATEGESPSALVQGVDGNFYGTAAHGGEFGRGTVFRMTPDGYVTVLHAFSGGSADGSSPQAGVVQTSDGTLYGTTAGGGTQGFGTVYKLSADGSFSVLRSVYAHDGDYSPMWMPGITLATDGNLYGVVPHGKGADSDIFRITPSGSFTIVGRIDGNDDLPAGPPIQAPDGNLYGLTWNGAVYKIGLDGSFANLTSTGAEHMEMSSAALISGDDGYLYGTTGGFPDVAGFVFRLQVPMPALMTIDEPGPSPANVAQPFSFSGWALDLAPNPSGGTGIDAVHVWAFPASGAGPIFVGAASYGLSRPDVAAAFGSTRFNASGFGLDVQGLSAGTYRLDAFAHSTRTGTFTIARSVSIVVPSPQMAIDTPVADAIVPAAFTLSGWALDPAAASGTGIDAVHVYAYPQAGGAPIFLGVADYGGSRPDVGAIFGARFTNSGFSLAASGLAPGAYRLAVFIHSTASDVFSAQTRDITVRAGNPLMFVDSPRDNGLVTFPFPFEIRGWAVDADAAIGTGVDAIHVWGYPEGGSPVFLGVATYGLSRPDVGAYLGDTRFAPSGYSLFASHLAPGRWQIVVFAHSTVTGTFNQVRVVTILYIAY